MRLKSLTLRQFRNHELLELNVDKGVNLFLGSNGAGKTNIIEGLAVLATGVSPRGGESETMVQWNKDGFGLEGTFEYEDPNLDPFTLEMKYRSGSPRTIRQNGKITVRLKDLMGKVPLVSFVPEDLALVKGEPDLRRRALNMILMQIDPVYAEVLKRYQDALKARNAALRQLAEGFINRDALDPWDQAVVESGVVVARKRDVFLREFSQRVSQIHGRMSGGQEQMELEYRPSYPGPWENEDIPRLKQHLRELLSEEIALGATLRGPHRDDILFLLNGKMARSFGSEGQKRTAAVAFKLAEIPTVEERLGQKPICLLDDVLSELDARRAQHLLQELADTGQCFVTMTGLESWPPGVERPAAIYRVDETGVKHENSEEKEDRHFRSASRGGTAQPSSV